MKQKETTHHTVRNTSRRGASHTLALVSLTVVAQTILLAHSSNAFGQSISDNQSGDVEIVRQCDGWVNFNGSSLLIHQAPPDEVISTVDISFQAYHPDGNELLKLSLFHELGNRFDVFDGSLEGNSIPQLERDADGLSVSVGRPVNGWYTFGGCLLGENTDGAYLDGWSMTVHYRIPGDGQGLNELELIVPAAAHIPGVGGSVWRTDLEIKATGPGGASFAISLLEHGRNNNDPLRVTASVGPGQAVRYVDAVQGLFGHEGAAALSIIPITGQILGTTRTYDDNPEGTHGAFIPALPMTQAASFGDEAVILQLSSSPSENDGFRTNLGVVNLTDESLMVRIDLFPPEGSRIGTLNRQLKPREYRQVNDIINRIDGTQVDDAYAVVTTPTVDGKFVAYASVVDNASQDSIFIPAQVVEGGNQ